MRIRCVGGIVRDEGGRLLVIRRGRPPSEGLWSIPGGRVEAGESDAAAVVRELREETGLDVAVGALAGMVERPGQNDLSYEIYDYVATVIGGVLTAGDDAAEARWVDGAELRALPTTPGLLDALDGWGLLPGGRLLP
ncbi:NUDIX hydrolase [Spirillospora sp. CA-294931]|uniref:NUDIX hydrolase n=1 Tax=Spirillospora sp. CA-294931 TaxID=3240042 RepID=UPI003D945012